MNSANDTQPIIELKQVQMRFGDFVVHRDINLSINQAETVTILGPSGTGKTLILKMIIGLLRASSGEVNVLGQNLTELSEDDIIPVRSNIGMLFQGAALFDSLNVYENIAYSLREARTYSEEQIAEIVESRLEVVGLPEIAKKYPPELSGGQKKRVGLARALASSPKIVLFDEPTTGLDPTAIRMIDDLIIKLRDEFQITSVVVTHDIESARRVSDRWILIDQGRVLANGPVEQVLSSSQDVYNFAHGNWGTE